MKSRLVTLFVLLGFFISMQSMMPALAAANRPGSFRTLQIAPADNQIRHIQYSGLAGHKPGHPQVTPAQVDRDMKRLVQNTDLITVTEVETTARANAMKQPGWALCWKSGGQTGVLYRKAMFDMSWCRQHRVTNARYWNNIAGRWVSPPPVTAAMLRIKSSNTRVLVSVAHTVSCAFSRNDRDWIPSNQVCATGRTTNNRAAIYHNSFRVKAYKAHMAGWVNWVRSLRSTSHPAVVITAGDFNLDFKMPWVRQYIEQSWARAGDWKMSWQNWHDNDYTHLMKSSRYGTYKILMDGDLISGESVSYQRYGIAFPEMVSSDHSPMEDVIQTGQ